MEVRMKQQKSGDQRQDSTYSVVPRLLDLAQREDRNHRVLADMLWEIQAAPKLCGLIHIARRIREILDFEADDGRFVDQHPTLEAWRPLLDWLLCDPVTLADRLFKDGIASAKSSFLAFSGRNPVIGNSAQSHRLYCLLWDRGPAEWPEDVSRRFLILQAQMLAAHAAILRHERRRIEQGEEPRAWLEERLYAPAVYCWRFEQKREPWRSAVANLPYMVKTHAYMEALRDAFRMDTDDMLEESPESRVQESRSANDVVGTVTRIRWFLRWGQNSESFHLVTFDRDIEDQGPECSSGPSDDESGEQQGGEYSNENNFTFTFGDADDEDTPAGKLHVHPTGNRSSRQKHALLEAGEYPDEPEPNNTVELAENEALAGITRAGAPEKANQLLPWSWESLSTIELARAMDRLAWAIDPEITENELIELRALVECMLWTGQSLQQCLALSVYTDGTTPPDSDLSLRILDDPTRNTTSAIWRVRALRPPYHSQIDSPPGDREREEFLEFTDLYGAHWVIRNVLKRTASVSGDPLPEEPVRLFKRNPQWYVKELKALLSRIDETGRVTAARLSRVVFQRIVESSGGDIVAAAIITRTDHSLASVRLFYSTPSAKRLVALHKVAMMSLVEDLARAGFRRTVTSPLTLPRVGFSVGSRMSPTIDAIRQAMETMKRRILRQVQLFDHDHKLDEFVAKHNEYSLYCVWMQMFSVGTRGILTPYVHLSAFDEATHLATIADKDRGDGYKRRLIWVPDSVWRQMQHYERYLHRIHACHDLPKPSRRLPCYFLRLRGKKLQMVRIRPVTIRRIIGSRFPFPANFPRRFMRTEFLETAVEPSDAAEGVCPPEFVDCWMGHHFRGEEPWGPYSSFSFVRYLRELNSRLEPMLARLGFEPISLEPLA